MSTTDQFTVSLGNLAQVPNMIGEIRSLVETVQALAEVPQAAASTGSPAASAGIIALGIALADFFVQAFEALDDDIDAIRNAGRTYEVNETQLVADATRGTTALQAFA